MKFKRIFVIIHLHIEMVPLKFIIVINVGKPYFVILKFH